MHQVDHYASVKVLTLKLPQSFFALPYFSSDVEAFGMRHFWIYWVVTIPLTFMTLLVWTWYTKIVNPASENGDVLERKVRNKPSAIPLRM